MASTDSIISISSIRKGSAHPDASRRTLQVTEKDNEWFIEIRDAFNPDLESDYEMPMPVCICLWSTTTRPLDKVLEHRHLLDLLYHSITFKKDNGETHPDGLTKERSCLPSEASPPIGGPITCAVFSDLLNMLSSLKLGKVFKLITKFCPTDGGTANVRFDGNTKTFYLPVITLKHTSEVVMRNLVVYETMAKSKTKSLNFKRYTELMSAIVDTIEDVELLKKARVLTTVPNKQKEEAKALESDIVSDAEIVETFNEMTKTMESKDWFIDEAIREANKCYNKHREVCDVYSCPGLFHTIKKTWRLDCISVASSCAPLAEGQA
ncbi:Protein of unknown function DUF247 [Theobroma cacao]|nr:Protein of unknown function DUF247 [Theobroma cacao]